MNSWDELPGQDHEEETEITTSLDKLYDSDLKSYTFEAAERDQELRNEEVSDKAHHLQLKVEEAYHEDGNIVVYGILDDEVFPAIVGPENDSDIYSSPELVEKSEEMAPIEYFTAQSSSIGDELEGALPTMRPELPQGLENYAEELIEDVETENTVWGEANGTYILSRLTEDEYNRI